MVCPFPFRSTPIRSFIYIYINVHKSIPPGLQLYAKRTAPAGAHFGQIPHHLPHIPLCFSSSFVIFGNFDTSHITSSFPFRTVSLLYSLQSILFRYRPSLRAMSISIRGSREGRIFQYFSFQFYVQFSFFTLFSTPRSCFIIFNSS